MTSMPDADYRRIKAVNYSGLKLFANSPLHYWDRYLNPDREPEKPTSALAIGNAVHCRTLEGLEEFSRRYARAVKFDRRTKEGKAGMAAFEESIGDAEVLSQEDYDLSLEISHAVLKSKMASRLLEGANGYSEEVVQWIDGNTGLLCKSKVDRLQTINNETYVIDLKTVGTRFGDCLKDEFPKSCARLKYHWQAAFYLDGVAASGEWGPPAGFIWVTVEKSPPYGVAIFKASDQMLQIGREQVAEAMERFAECQEADKWPGFDTEIIDLQLPRWAA